VSDTSYKSDVLLIGGGLAGLTTAIELLNNNRKVLLIDRDEPDKLGGLAKKAFGGIMFVGTPHQRKLGIDDSPDLALADWHRCAHFGEDDHWPRQWAETYVHRSIELIYDWLSKLGISFLPLVNWPERGVYQPLNSVPRWHIAWGTGQGVIEAIINHLDQHPNRQNLTMKFGHRVERLTFTNKRVTGCSGVLEDGGTPFEASGDAVVLATGGMCGGDLSFIKRHWHKPWGNPPPSLLNGAHPFADGMIHDAVADIGGSVTHLDKQWLYAGGIHHPNPTREADGLSVVPPRSALWVNALGERIGPTPLMGYTDTRYVVEQICQQPEQYSWQILNMKIALKELAISGSAHMKAFRDKSKLQVLRNVLFGNKDLVNHLVSECKDFVVADSVPKLVDRMNALDNPVRVDGDRLQADIAAYDAQIDRGPRYMNDDQLRRIANFRAYRGDRIRVCKFQKINDPKALPLIAIREFILTRKSLGGIQTDLEGRVINTTGEPISGLYAVGEAAGYGGGGIHGRGSLEGTFLGSCILTGRMTGQSLR
jgi:predicted oxidoreductase